MNWIGGLLALIGLFLAGFGLAFFSPDMVEGAGLGAAEALRPDHRLLAGFGVLVVISFAAGVYLRQIGEASIYLFSLLGLTLLGAGALVGVTNWVFFETLYTETSWMGRTGENLLRVVPGTLGSLVGASSGEDAALRAGAGLAKGLGQTLVDMVRHPGFETIPNGPLTLLVGLPLLVSFVVFNVGVAPRISQRFHADQPLWLRLSAQVSLFAGVFIALTALYLNLLARQSVNLAGTLAAG